MKKILLLVTCQFFIMCSTTNIQVRDDFKSVSDTEKAKILKSLNATASNKSVLILTQGFKGEQISAFQNNKKTYADYPISNLKTKYADSFSFENTTTLILKDNFSNEEIKIEPKNATKYKFIYVMKKYENEKAKYLLTYSNTLRPLK